MLLRCIARGIRQGRAYATGEGDFIPRLSPPNPAAGGNFWPKEISMLLRCIASPGIRQGPPTMLLRCIARH